MRRSGERGGGRTRVVHALRHCVRRRSRRNLARAARRTRARARTVPLLVEERDAVGPELHEVPLLRDGAAQHGGKDLLPFKEHRVAVARVREAELDGRGRHPERRRRRRKRRRWWGGGDERWRMTEEEEQEEEQERCRQWRRRRQGGLGDAHERAATSGGADRPGKMIDSCTGDPDLSIITRRPRQAGRRGGRPFAPSPGRSVVGVVDHGWSSPSSGRGAQRCRRGPTGSARPRGLRDGSAGRRALRDGKGSRGSA